MMMKSYELLPCDSHKSFYGKARVFVAESGAEILHSYDTDVLYRDENGQLFRMWDGWSATTGRHIKSFCGLNKAGYMALPSYFEDDNETNSDMTWQDSLKVMYARRAM